MKSDLMEKKGKKCSPGFVLWFTGFSGSGKSTIATEVVSLLRESGIRVELLDGDEVRTHLSKGLGFSKEGRDANIRRLGWVGHVLSRNGMAAVVAAISPYRSIRNENRKIAGRFVEVFVDRPLEECIRLDPKGMYKKALEGQIKNFTGVSDPYEPPLNPEVHLFTSRETVPECVGKVMQKLRELQYI